MHTIKKYKYELCLFCAILLFKVENIFNYTFPWAGDETLTLAGGMYFAGYDWSNYAGNASYYGFGYVMLLSPLMRVIDNPEMLYRCMLMINNICMGAIGVLIYKIAKEQIKVNAFYSLMSAILFITFQPICLYSNSIISEVPFTLWIVLITYQLVRLINMEGTSKKVASCILAITMPCGYLLHSRCLILYVCFFVVLLGYHICFRKTLISYWLFFVVAAIEFIAVIFSVKFVQKEVWLLGSNGELVNSPDAVATELNHISDLFSLKDINDYLQVVLSNIATFNYVSCGVIALSIAAICILILRHRTDLIENKALFIVFSLGITCFFSMIFCQSLLVFKNIALGKDLKWLCYVRYASVFVYLLYLCMVYYFDKYGLGNKKDKLFWWVVFLNIFTVICCKIVLIPKLEDTYIGSTTIYNIFLLPMKNMDNVTNLSRECLQEDMLLFLLMIQGMLMFLLMKNRKMLLLFIITCNVFFHMQESEIWINFRAKQYNAVDETVHLIRDSADMDKYNIYVCGNGEYQAEMRYGLYNYKVEFINIEDIKDIEKMNGVLLTSDPKVRDLLPTQGHWITISEKQFLYTCKDEIYQTVCTETER